MEAVSYFADPVVARKGPPSPHPFSFLCKCVPIETINTAGEEEAEKKEAGRYAGRKRTEE